MGVPELESGTSSLSATRSNQLSYTPVFAEKAGKSGDHSGPTRQVPLARARSVRKRIELSKPTDSQHRFSTAKTPLPPAVYHANNTLDRSESLPDGVPAGAVFFGTIRFGLKSTFPREARFGQNTSSSDFQPHPYLNKTATMKDRASLPKTLPFSPSACYRSSRWRVPMMMMLPLWLTATTLLAGPSAEQALSLRPIQADAVFEKVPEGLVDQCTVSNLDSDQGRGWMVTGPDGTPLRRFVDTNGDGEIDMWCYFNFGVESYRDIDSDFNKKTDQYRWLGNSGTRWGLDRDEDGKIEAWKRISAEEVTYELIAAIRSSDRSRFASLLATPDELESLGLGKAKRDQIESKAKRAAADFESLAKKQKVISKNTQWLQFAAPAPGLVPSGTDGSTKDILVYENVIAMYDTEGESGQLMVGTLVRVGDRWRMVGLPNVGDEEGTITSTAGIFFSTGPNADALAGQASDSEMQALVTQLESIDQQLAEAKEGDAERLHAARADLVEKLIVGSANPQDRIAWARQLIDTVSGAVQRGQYPDGLARIREASAKFAKGNAALAAYADYEAVQAEYVLRQTPDADFEKVQKWYLEALADFVDQHPRTVQSAKAMLQLALSKEFEDKEKDALAYYRKVRDGFKGTDVGEKAAGAVRRLESVGRRIELTGKTFGGKTFELSQLRGRPVVIHYWATWCEPCKQDMKLLSRLQTRYKRAGLTLVGINVDARREDAETYLRQNQLPWIQLFEEGGLELSRLSQAFGVQTLPTMMLVDKNGTVVQHNIRAAELDTEIEAMLKK